MGLGVKLSALEYDLSFSIENDAVLWKRLQALIAYAAKDVSCRLLVLNTCLLRNKRAFGFAKGQQFRLLWLPELDVREVAKACSSHGHLSALFIPKSRDEFARQASRLGLRDHGVALSVATGDATDPLGVEGASALRAFLATDLSGEVATMFGFSHDALQFYEISRRLG